MLGVNGRLALLESLPYDRYWLYMHAQVSAVLNSNAEPLLCLV